MKLMCADGYKVRIELMNVFERLLSEPLHGIRMKDDTSLTAKRAQFRHRLQRPNLIISRHDGHKDRVRPKRLLQIILRNQSVTRNGQISDLKPFLLSQVLKA